MMGRVYRYEAQCQRYAIIVSLYSILRVVIVRERSSFPDEASRRVLYFFWPPETASEMDWPAFWRVSWAEPSMLEPWFWAESPPERVESPTFWVADLSPSVVVLAGDQRWVRE
jgi:hypothetical protein